MNICINLHEEASANRDLVRLDNSSEFIGSTSRSFKPTSQANESSSRMRSDQLVRKA